MLGNRLLILHTLSEVYSLLKPWADEEFYDFSQASRTPGAVYVFGRRAFLDNIVEIREMAASEQYVIVFCNAAEGSWTLQSQLKVIGIEDLVFEKKVLLISGGEQEAKYRYVQFDHFLNEIVNYDSNHEAVTHSREIFEKTSKPWKFLFLNGRARPHRKYLYERFKASALLDQCLWTMLDSRPSPSKSLQLMRYDLDLMTTTSELKWLPKEYEIETYQDSNILPGPPKRTFVKNDLFKNEWGEIYLKPQPYIDTYFSLVTETVFEQPWPFRTEKIAKPIMIGHPFVVATSVGYYQDLRRLGFKTFGHVIDESFDQIENHRDRMDRIFDIVTDLCQQDLASFLRSCEEVCKYNQQHHVEFVQDIRKKFPSQFEDFLQHHQTP